MMNKNVVLMEIILFAGTPTKREQLMPIMCTAGPGMEAGGTLGWCHRSAEVDPGAELRNSDSLETLAL